MSWPGSRVGSGCLIEPARSDSSSAALRGRGTEYTCRETDGRAAVKYLIYVGQCLVSKQGDYNKVSELRHSHQATFEIHLVDRAGNFPVSTSQKNGFLGSRRREVDQVCKTVRVRKDVEVPRRVLARERVAHQ